MPHCRRQPNVHTASSPSHSPSGCLLLLLLNGGCIGCCRPCYCFRRHRCYLSYRIFGSLRSDSSSSRRFSRSGGRSSFLLPFMAPLPSLGLLRLAPPPLLLLLCVCLLWLWCWRVSHMILLLFLFLLLFLLLLCVVGELLRRHRRHARPIVILAMAMAILGPIIACMIACIIMHIYSTSE